MPNPNFEPSKSGGCQFCGAEVLLLQIRGEGSTPLAVNMNPINVYTISGQLVRGYIPHWVTCPKGGQ